MHRNLSQFTVRSRFPYSQNIVAYKTKQINANDFQLIQVVIENKKPTFVVNERSICFH